MLFEYNKKKTTKLSPLNYDCLLLLTDIEAATLLIPHLVYDKEA